MPLNLDFVAANGVPFRAVRLAAGEHGNYPAAVATEPVVEFYDRRYPHTEDGQFTGARYYVATIMGRDAYGSGAGGLSLDGGSPDWTVDALAMALVRSWLGLAERVDQGRCTCVRCPCCLAALTSTINPNQ